MTATSATQEVRLPVTKERLQAAIIELFLMGRNEEGPIVPLEQDLRGLLEHYLQIKAGYHADIKEALDGLEELGLIKRTGVGVSLNVAEPIPTS